MDILLITRNKRATFKQLFNKRRSAVFIRYILGYKGGSLTALSGRPPGVQDSDLALCVTCCDLLQCTILKLPFTSAFLIPNSPKESVFLLSCIRGRGKNPVLADICRVIGDFLVQGKISL